MKQLITLVLLFIGVVTYSQDIYTTDTKPETCCQHLDEEYGDTWTILYWAKSKSDAIYMIDRYRFFDIANNYFESNGEYYIELVDPSDTLEHIKKYDFNLFNDYHKTKLIYIDFLVDDNNKPLLDEKGNVFMFKMD